MKCLIFIFLTTFSFNSWAQDITAQTVTLKKGEVAPFDGALLNASAIAQIISEKKYILKECELDKNYQIQKNEAKHQLDLGMRQTELDSTKKQFDITVKTKDDQIKMLNDVVADASKRENNTKWWFVGGVGIGIAAAVATFFAINYGAK